MGSDVKACPCKTIVPCITVTCSRKSSDDQPCIDLGLALTHYEGKLQKRIIDTGGLAKKDRITHRIEITSIGEIDGEVRSG